MPATLDSLLTELQAIKQQLIILNSKQDTLIQHTHEVHLQTLENSNLLQTIKQYLWKIMPWTDK